MFLKRSFEYVLFLVLCTVLLWDGIYAPPCRSVFPWWNSETFWKAVIIVVIQGKQFWPLFPDLNPLCRLWRVNSDDDKISRPTWKCKKLESSYKFLFRNKFFSNNRFCLVMVSRKHDLKGRSGVLIIVRSRLSPLFHHGSCHKNNITEQRRRGSIFLCVV